MGGSGAGMASCVSGHGRGRADGPGHRAEAQALRGRELRGWNPRLVAGDRACGGRGVAPRPPSPTAGGPQGSKVDGKSAQDPRGQSTDLPGASPGLWGKSCREGQRIKDLKVT